MKNQSKTVKTLVFALALCLLAVFAAAAVAEGDMEFISGDIGLAQDGEAIMDAEVEWEQSHIEVWREGEADTIPVETLRVVNFDTTIAMAPEYFTYKVCDNIDTFSYEAWQGERPVYYSVYHVDSNPSDIVDGLVTTYGDRYGAWNVFVTKVSSYDATTVQFDGEAGCPAYQRHFFIIPTVDGSIVIEAQFDIEMYQGLYRIMLALFDTLHIG